MMDKAAFARAHNQYLTPPEDDQDVLFENILNTWLSEVWNDLEDFIDTDIYYEWFNELADKLEYDYYDMDEDTGEMKEYYSPGITEEQMAEYLARRFYCYKKWSNES